MDGRKRTPFGDLVYRYRTAMNLTQSDVVELTANSRTTSRFGALSLRSLQTIEHEYAPGERWRMPRKATVTILADAFGLLPGSDRWDEFVAASQIRLDRAEASRTARDVPIALMPTSFDDQDVDERPAFFPQGREAQIARLRTAVRGLLHGSSGVAFVSAEPGTGKTALLTHICAEALGQAPDLVVLWGDCVSRENRANPGQAIRQALDVMVGDIATASPNQVLSANHAARILARSPVAIDALLRHGAGSIGQLVSTAALADQLESGRLTGDLADRLRRQIHDLNPTPGAPDIDEQVFRTLADYAAAGPVILVLEDLHWADAATAAAILYLMRRLYRHRIPILLIGSYRASDLDLPRSGQPPAISMVVREAYRLYPASMIDLSKAVGAIAGRAFVDAIVGATIPRAPVGLANDIFRLTGGLPLFVVALLEWYRAEQKSHLILPDHTADWSPDLRQAPARLEGAISYLIDRIPAPLQMLAALASVQGTTFLATVLQHAAKFTPADLLDSLDERLYRQYQLVEPAGVSTIAGIRDHSYRFRHVMLRDVLYQRLSDFEREHDHAATADAMVELWGAKSHDGSASIAYHYAQAGNRSASAEYALQAGIHDLMSQEFGRARAVFESIRDLGPGVTTPLVSIQSLIGLGNCRRGEGDLVASRKYFDEALVLARNHRLPIARGYALMSRAMLDFDAGDMSLGQHRLVEAVSILLDEREVSDACRALYLLSYTLQGIGHYDEAEQRASEALALARESGDDRLIVGSMVAFANARLEVGYYDEAIEIYQSGLTVSRDASYQQGAVLCWLNLALAHNHIRQIDLAREALEPVFALRDKIPARHLAVAEFNLAVSHELSMNLDAAESHYATSLDIRDRVGQHALALDSLAGLVRVALHDGRLADARTYLVDLDRRIEARGFEGADHPGAIYIARYRAGVALGDELRARMSLRDAIGFLRERTDWLHMPEDRASYLARVSANRILIDYGYRDGILRRGDPLLVGR